MSKLLKNLSAMFRQSTNGHQDNAKHFESDCSRPDPMIPENLFIEKEEPQVDESVMVHPKESKLTSFLKRDFSRIGYSDGYRYHTSDVLDNYKRLLSSEFRQIMDFMIDDLRSSQAKLQKHLVDVRSLSRKAEEKTSNRIQEIQETIARLDQEKDMCFANRPFRHHLPNGGFMQDMPARLYAQLQDPFLSHPDRRAIGNHCTFRRTEEIICIIRSATGMPRDVVGLKLV